MRVHRLAIDGIGPYAERQDLDFDRLSSGGLFLLTGPTGAGKTTILDAIVYALYGTVPGVRGDGSRGGRATSERIVSDLRSVDSQPEVELEFTVSGRRLRIIRVPQHLRPKARGDGTTVEKSSVALSEWIDGAWVPRSADQQEVGIEIAGLLGMNASQFAQVVLLPQGEFAGFLRAGVKERQAVLERLFRVDEFQTAEAWFEDRAREARARLQDAEGELRGLVDQLAGALGEACGELPAERTLDAVELWVGERRFEADEWRALARVDLEASAAAKLASDRALRATEEHRSRVEAQESRAAALAGLDVRLTGARDWIRRHEDPMLADDPARWADAARSAHDEVARLEAHRGDAQRAEALAAAAGRSAAEAEAAEQAALAADARVHELGPHLESARAQAARAEVAEETVLALEHERDRIATALQARARAAALQQERAAAAAQADVAAGAARDGRARATALPAPEEAEAMVAGLVDQLGRAELVAAERRSAQAGTEAEIERTAATIARVAGLTARLAEASAEHRDRTDQWQSARSAHLSAREARLDAMAAELAATLDERAACPVCGSTDHPAPAPQSPGGDLRAAEAQAEEVEQAARREVERTHALVAEVSGQLDAIEGRDGLEAHRAELTQQVAAMATQIAADRDQIAELTRSLGAARTTLDDARGAAAAVLTADAAVIAAQHRLAVIDAELESAIREAGPDPLTHDDLERATREVERLRAMRADAAAARDRVTSLEAQLEAARTEVGQQRQSAAAAAAAARTARAQATEILERIGQLVAPHASLDEASTHATRRAQTLSLAASVLVDFEAAKGELAAATAAVGAATEAEALGDDEPAELAERLASRARAAADADRARAEADARLRDAERHVDAIQRAGAALDQARAALGPAAEEAERLQRLDATVRGLGDNSRRMSLTTYVLAARLEEVADAATAHLQRMSGGRYALVHHDERFGNGPAGLGLRVLDAHSGEERDTATLSGGEAFYASLALALGLADVVQREAGGRPLETLLVDEGFGSLDADTLEEVLGELDELRAAGRAIGLVSHVPALAERIPAQLRVTAGPSGSTARVVVGEHAT